MTTISYIKKWLYVALLNIFLFVFLCIPLSSKVYAESVPNFQDDFVKQLTFSNSDNEEEEKEKFVINPGKFNIDKDKTLRQNIIELFYPSKSTSWNAIYSLIRSITLWIMICFIVWAWASLLFGSKPEDVKKTLSSLIYILLWWLFVYMANRLFSILSFNWWNWWIVADIEPGTGNIEAVVNEVKWWVFFTILSALKAFAFFLAIIMTVITWFKVIAAWDGEKWKKLVKWLINVVVALLIIKWIDVIYAIAANSTTFVQNAANFIINVAKVFGYIYWVIIVIMVIVAWYLYITDGWSWSNFKKASNILVNILLSWLVLFSFLLITYQIFAEFKTWWDAVTDATSFIIRYYV